MNQLFLDVTRAIIQNLPTVIAALGLVITALGFWITYKTYLRTPEQKPNPPNSKTSATSIPSEIQTELVVFQTEIQLTKLKSAEKGLECYLIDARPGKASGLQWQLSIEEINEVLEKNDYSVTPGYRLKTGDFSIGPRKKWLYSKTLFPKPEELRQQLKTLLASIR